MNSNFSINEISNTISNVTLEEKAPAQSAQDAKVQEVAKYNFVDNPFKKFHDPKSVTQMYDRENNGVSTYVISLNQRFFQDSARRELWYAVYQRLQEWALIGDQNPNHISERQSAVETIAQAIINQPVTLNLSGRYLETLPQEIGFLFKLVKLQLANNKLTTLPAEICHLGKLQELNLGYNKLSVLPGVLGMLPSLLVVRASYNQLVEIEDGLCDSKSLEELHLERNKLSSLPARFSRLYKFRRLILIENQFTEVPEVLGKMKNLTALSFKNNKDLQVLPEFLKNCTEMCNIDVEGTKIDVSFANKFLEEIWAAKGDL